MLAPALLRAFLSLCLSLSLSGATDPTIGALFFVCYYLCVVFSQPQILRRSPLRLRVGFPSPPCHALGVSVKALVNLARQMDAGGLLRAITSKSSAP